MSRGEAKIFWSAGQTDLATYFGRMAYMVFILGRIDGVSTEGIPK